MSNETEWPEFEKHSGIYHRHDDEIIELNKEQYNHARLCVNACAGLPDETLSLDVIERLTSLNTMQSEMERLVERNAELEQQRGELAAKLEEADSLAKLAIHLNKEFATRMEDCKERFTHEKDCMRSLSYRKDGWPCTCETLKALAKAGAQGKGI